MEQTMIRKLLAVSFVVALFSSTSEVSGQQTPNREQQVSGRIELRAASSTFLYCSKANSVSGDLALQSGRNMAWTGNAQLGWQVDAPSDEDYELYLIANVREEGRGVNMVCNANGSLHHLRLEPTTGPYTTESRRGRNFQRLRFASTVFLRKGPQNVMLSTTGVRTGKALLDIRSIELVPLSAKQSIESERKRAIASRTDATWMSDAGYGLMFHWTSQSVNPDGSRKEFAEAVNDFDVQRFARMVGETGAGYVIFTVGHAEQYCPAPLQNWERCHPGKTTERDLMGEIANELKAEGVRLICYLHSAGTARFGLVKNDEFFRDLVDILSEMGERYEDRLAGYWFDCWYQIFEGYPDVPFEALYRACKAGNKDRIIALNSWIYPPVTPWQDFWAGEVGNPIEIPVHGYMRNGPAPELPYQALLTMENYWVQKTARIPEPKFKSSELSRYIRDCMENGGAVTINLGIYQNGTVGAGALQVMKGVKSQIR
jgi:hypothetical protein